LIFSGFHLRGYKNAVKIIAFLELEPWLNKNRFNRAEKNERFANVFLGNIGQATLRTSKSLTLKLNIKISQFLSKLS